MESTTFFFFFRGSVPQSTTLTGRLKLQEGLWILWLKEWCQLQGEPPMSYTKMWLETWGVAP